MIYIAAHTNWNNVQLNDNANEAQNIFLDVFKTIYDKNLIKLKSNKLLTAKDYFKGIRNGNSTLLSKSITLIESTNLKHQKLAEEIIELCTPFSGDSIRIGITGVPGVGKSTFIETFGSYLIEKEDKKVAVLAIDPSSKKSGGSILGDKTRMNELSVNKNAFIVL